jgi:hypothetical protein
MSLRLALLCAAGAAIVAGCAEPTAPTARQPQLDPSSAMARDVSTASVPPGCTFGAGTLTCVIVDEVYQTSTHTAVSGCLYGPNGLPGRRERVFEDTYLLTATTTTFQHGLAGIIYDHSTVVTRTLVSSTQISDTCVPL